MARDFAKSFYASSAWKQARTAYRKKCAGLCERCLAAGLYTPGDIVHHKIPLTPENVSNTVIALSFENLELVCRDHHAEAHGKPKRYTVDEFGRVACRG